VCKHIIIKSNIRYAYTNNPSLGARKRPAAAGFSENCKMWYNKSSGFDTREMYAAAANNTCRKRLIVIGDERAIRIRIGFTLQYNMYICVHLKLGHA